jgi:syntaxin 8
MANANQYFLLADHIKLSLLERQRAVSLNLEPTSQDGHISRSLDSLREGLESVSEERLRLQESGETAYAPRPRNASIELTSPAEHLSPSPRPSRTSRRNTTI